MQVPPRTRLDSHLQPPRVLAVPKRVVLALARAAQRIWWPALSPEVKRRYIDGADMSGYWAFVDVKLDKVENHAITSMRRYRSAYVSTLSMASRLCPSPTFFFSLAPSWS